MKLQIIILVYYGANEKFMEGGIASLNVNKKINQQTRKPGMAQKMTS